MCEKDKLMVAIALAVLAMLSITCSTVLAWTGKPAPDSLTAIGGACVGGLVTYLAFRPNGKGPSN